MLRLILCLLVGFVYSQEVQIEEIRDKPQTAFELRVFNDATSNASTTFYAGQPRWFKILVNDNGWMSVQVRANPQSDFAPLLNVYAVEGNKLKRVGSSEKKTDKKKEKGARGAVVRTPLKAIEYYIEVTGTVTEKGGFNLFLAQSGREDNYPEKQKDAEPIELRHQVVLPDNKLSPLELKGAIDEESRNDWLTFVTPKAGYVTAEIFRTPESNLHTHIRLHTERALVAQNDEKVVRQVKEGEVYWLHIRAGDDNSAIKAGREGVGRYMLHLTYAVPPEREKE